MKTLRQIVEEFDFKKDSVIEMAQCIVDAWDTHYGSAILHEPDDAGDQIVELHTGGWSENEEILDQIEHTMFWGVFWWKSERGGHYWLKVHEIK